jgi:hypothetical protein
VPQTAHSRMWYTGRLQAEPDTSDESTQSDSHSIRASTCDVLRGELPCLPQGLNFGEAGCLQGCSFHSWHRLNDN